ncbi:MAG: YwmB family TATA-box binding protein [Bacillaceae bacterium]|nr:YwmB family TATA-box binding protein [Bacillaceae bacterium]
MKKTFISLSAYTELWDTYIITNQKKMNLQVALRNTGMGGETTITIGTPIITVEY